MLTISSPRPIGHSARTVRPARWACPACHNADRATIACNGLPAYHPELTLLCLAQTGPCGDPDPENPDDLTCGMQWDPNAD